MLGLAMAANAMKWLAPVLVRLFPVIEPLAPRYVSYYIRRYLRDWKNRDLILDYRTRARRLGKFHYKIVVDLYLTPNQTSRILRQRLFQAFKRR
jgi:hypothetical protein